MFQYLKSSPKCLAKITSYEDKIGTSTEMPAQTVYPLDRLHIGQSLAIPFDEASETSLRALAYQKAKKSGKKFKVVKHSDPKLYEVARIA